MSSPTNTLNNHNQGPFFQRAFNACRAFPKVPDLHSERLQIYTHSWAGRNYMSFLLKTIYAKKKVSLNSKASATKTMESEISTFLSFYLPGDKTHSKKHPLFQTPRLDHWNRLIPRLQCWHKRWSRNACEADLDAMISASYSCCFIRIPSGKLT